MENIRFKNEETNKDIFSHYRNVHPYLFSDSIISYNVPLTEELFDYKLSTLSSDKKQSEFEKFILRLACKIITPNIKPQSGPDGGGDGKVDGETYAVSESMADKWFVGSGCWSDNEYWAIAISCKKEWRPKIESDVKKIVETKRGYSKILFFSNQIIKSSTLHNVEDTLSKQYKIDVKIFDKNWCKFVTFNNQCMDIALEELSFSEVYKQKTIVKGPNDIKNEKALEEIEKEINAYDVKDLDTNYIELLRESYFLSRNLERPITETEGRFLRSIRECTKHGTRQQMFNIIYDHAWTSYYWFKNPVKTHDDFVILKEYVDEKPIVARVEKITNLSTILFTACYLGLINKEILQDDKDYLSNLYEKIKNVSKYDSSCLYLSIYFDFNKIIELSSENKNINGILDDIEIKIKKSEHYTDINFESEYTIISLLGQIVQDNPRYDNLVDSLAYIVSRRESEVAGAKIHLERGQKLLYEKKYIRSIKQFGFCIQAFEKEGLESELVRTCGYLGLALWGRDLPYSAEAYLVRAASILIKDFYTQGTISHLLITILMKLCEIEVLLGRLVMFLNWNELLNVIAVNAQENQTKEFIEQNTIYDFGWACRFANLDLSNNVISILPDILERNGLDFSSNSLKFMLGHEDECSNDFLKIANENFRSNLRKQPINDQFVGNLTISQSDSTHIQTLAGNCTFLIEYENTCDNQVVAEIFLSAIESFFATLNDDDIIIISSNITIKIIETGDESEFKPEVNSSINYNLFINPKTFTDQIFWNCFSEFLAIFLSNNAVLKERINIFIDKKQIEENLMERVTTLMRNKLYINTVLGNNFKNKIEEWQMESDKKYTLLNKDDFKGISNLNFSNKQKNYDILNVNYDMGLWQGLEWFGCGFLFDKEDKYPPIFGLIFNDLNRGEKIISEWAPKNEISKVNIIIILGINKEHRSWYRVCIMPSIHQGPNETRYAVIMPKMKLMTPSDTKNIDHFKEVYNFYGCCWIFAFKRYNQSFEIPDNYKGAFKFSQISFVNAWEIKEGDIACSGILPTDDPYIPKDVIDAPIIKVLEKIRRISNH